MIDVGIITHHCNIISGGFVKDSGARITQPDSGVNVSSGFKLCRSGKVGSESGI